MGEHDVEEVEVAISATSKLQNGAHGDLIEKDERTHGAKATTARGPLLHGSNEDGLPSRSPVQSISNSYSCS